MARNAMLNFNYEWLALASALDSATFFSALSSTMPASDFAHGEGSSESPVEKTKPPCNCGCKGNKNWLSTARATAEFKRQLEHEVQLLLDKARHVKVNGKSREQYLNPVFKGLMSDEH